jgi:hypothetical protein
MGIGPSTKETTLHHYRDPLTDLLVRDQEVDFQGIVVAGTSDDNEHKFFIARRIGVLVEAMRSDGAIVCSDSWGNCHIDFASVIEAIGERNVPVVGMTFVGKQAAFVVTNSYMNSIIDVNKTSVGDENLVVGENTPVDLDAVKALSILKNKIRKKDPDRVWQPQEARRLRRLILRAYAVEGVALAERTGLDGRRLLLNAPALTKNCLDKLQGAFPEVKDVRLRVIAPQNHDVFVNSILDFSPVAAKVAGRPGEGISHVFSGVQVMLTAVEEDGFQPANIGSSEGILRERVLFGRHATPAADDFLINVDVLLATGEARTRGGIMAAHQACDEIVQEIRNELRGLTGSQAAAKRELWDMARPGGQKIVLVKLVSGLGCLYDTCLFPAEPAGYIGGKSIMDRSNNVQLVISPNEYRDGALRSLT